MSRSNITWPVRTKNTSLPRGNVSTTTASRLVKKTAIPKTPKKTEVQSEVVENFNKKVDDLVKPVSRPE